MHPIQPPKYPAKGPDTAPTAVVEKKPSKAQVRYSVREMKEAVSSGEKKREARRIFKRPPFLKDPSGELRRNADGVAEVFRHSRVSKVRKLDPSNPPSHPATRAGNVPTIQEMRQIKRDEFLARNLAGMVEGCEQTTSRYGNDIASHQSVSNRCGPPAGGFDRTCGAIVQQPSGNSSPVRQQFFAADFYTLLSELGSDQGEQLFHNLTDKQQEKFRDYCLKHVNLSEDADLMGLLFP